MGKPIRDIGVIIVGINSSSITHTSLRGSPTSVTQGSVQAILFSLA